MDYRILPPDDFLEARITLPLSKSMSNRELIIAALTPEAPLPQPVAVCDDTDAMLAALSSGEATDINIGAAGTTMRFLTAYFATQEGRTIRLDGSERMRHRPIGVLVDALRSLGAEIEYLGEEGFPPLLIHGRKLNGGTLTLDSSVSSQFISALLMIAPVMLSGLTLTLRGNTVSRSYIHMTLRLMEAAGIESEWRDDTITIRPQTYHPGLPSVEGDWSAAAAWYEIAAISAGAVSFTNLTTPSCQGDSRLAQFFRSLGIDTEIDTEQGTLDLLVSPDQDARIRLDLSDNPDLTQYLTVTCVMLGIPFYFTGLSTLRIKETDRIQALVTEMDRLGITLTTDGPGTLCWEGQRHPINQLPRFDTYDDHRMAMCLAPIAIFIPGIIINNVEVVTKSYPDFWDHLRQAGFTLLDGDAPLPDPTDEV